MVIAKEFLKLMVDFDGYTEFIFVDSENKETELEAVKGLWYDNLPTNNTYYVNSDYVVNDNDTLSNLTIVLNQEEFDNLIVTGFTPDDCLMYIYVERA